jgi:hypothetical protein
MTVFREQQILAQEDTNLNSLIIKGDSSTLSEIEKFIYSVDKEKSEVEIDVEILELNRNLVRNLGLDYGSTLSTVSMGKATGDSGAVSSSLNVNDLGDTNFYITLPSAAINFLESDDSSRLISKPNLRGIDGEDIKFMVGDEIPIPQTQFQAGAAGGISNIPVTSYKYENVGVEVKITPIIHRNNEVTLKIKLTLRFITGIQDSFPLFGKRELESVIRLKEGETSIVGGFIKDEVRGSLAGMPAIAKLPLLGRLFGKSTKDLKQSDLVFSITPRLIRKVEISEEDNKAIWSNITQEGQDMPVPDNGPREMMPETPSGNAVIISPPSRKIRANTTMFFSIRVNSSTDISSLSFNGSVSGGKAEIEELNGKIAGSDAKVLQNASGESFDLGYTFDARPIRNKQLASLKIKFLEEGNYSITLSNVTAFSKERQPVTLNGSSAQVEVYGAVDRERERESRERPEERTEERTQ